MDDAQKQAVTEMAKTYRPGVRRGDFTRTWAAEDCACKYTYPYASAAHFENVRALAFKWVK
jgi:hypothetical protein